jgi:tetratricopeptide (TPR) repeat protein
MKIKVIILSFIFTFCSLNSALALDWKVLHETADKTDMNQAEQAVSINPTSVKDLYILALVYLNAYRDDDAEKTFLRILDISKDSVEAQWGISEILRRKYELDKSTKKLEDIIKSNPEFSPAYITLAYIKFSLKDYEKAVNLSEVVIKQGQDQVDISNYVRAYLIFAGAQGMLADKSGPLAKAFHGLQVFPNLKRAKELLPDFPGVHFGLGAFYLLAPKIAGGDIDRAEEHLKKAIKLDPNLVDAYVRLAQVYKKKNDMKKFRKYLNMALEKDPKNFLANEIENANSA